jgi:beta-glucosidase
VQVKVNVSHLQLTSKKSSLYNESLQWEAGPGNFDLMIGTSSEDIRLKGSFGLMK